jgi:hypothetical protein
MARALAVARAVAAGDADLLSRTNLDAPQFTAILVLNDHDHAPPLAPLAPLGLRDGAAANLRARLLQALFRLGQSLAGAGQIGFRSLDFGSRALLIAPSALSWLARIAWLLASRCCRRLAPRQRRQ